MGSDFDLADLTRVPISERPSKVHPRDFASPPRPGGSFADFWGGLPHLLAAESLRALVAAVAGAAREGRGCLWMLGGHVVKTGLSPLLIDLMERGAVTHVAMNGATAIHDYETCRWGGTSEDVEAGLTDGTFGMALETGRDMNEAIARGRESELGLGAALAEDLAARDGDPAGGRRAAGSAAGGDVAGAVGLRHPDVSLLLACRRLGIGLSVHAAIGAEITHQHPEADGAAIGAASHQDFLALARALETLDAGGVAINVGSAVLLPEVFVKALALSRNLRDGRPREFTTANLDMIRHYRPRVNVVERPTRTGGGSGYEITGHHEITLPLLAWAVAEELAGG